LGPKHAIRQRGAVSPVAAPLPAGQEGESPLLGADGQSVLHDTRELDYMTHFVLRMFEDTT
jgi:hypothetical protein